MKGQIRHLAALVALLLALSCRAWAEEPNLFPGAVPVACESSAEPQAEAVPEGEPDATGEEALVEPVELSPEEIEADFGFEAADLVSEAPMEALAEGLAEDAPDLPEEPEQPGTEETPESPAPTEAPTATPSPEPTEIAEAPTPTPIDDATRQDVFSHIGKKRNAKRIPVLAYHRIVSDEEKCTLAMIGDRFSISLSQFTKQMAWLHDQQYTAITCDDMYRWHKGKLRLPKKSVLITFDDGYARTVEYALKVFQTYGLRGTFFIIGEESWLSDGSKYITRDRIRQLQKNCPWVDFQSHTWGIHQHMPDMLSYDEVLLDAGQQRVMYGFDYLAYPFGKTSKTMIRAYRDDGIKMAFLFGRKKNGYATRRQNLFRMRRIEVTADMSMRRFKRWCKREMK